ncbi:MAG: sensor histidine kinase [Parashewanella sp.]
MSNNKLLLGLVICASVVLFSLLANVHLYFEDKLITLSCLLLFTYLIGHLCIVFFNRQTQPLQQLVAFMRSQNEGKHNQQLCFEDSDSPYSELAALLLDFKESKLSNENSNTLINEALFNAWPMPVMLLNERGQLSYFNQAMYQHLNIPLLKGASFIDCGLSIKHNMYQHPLFASDWQLQQLTIDKQTLLLGYHIGKQINATRQQSQAEIIRVLSHELNNSLTPIASMSDTLLQTETLDESITRQALLRIRNRSDSLLKFIKSYTEINRLPLAKFERIHLQKLLWELAPQYQLSVEYHGQVSINADAVLFEQLLINLLKNSKEANATQVIVSVYSEKLHWKIDIVDDGCGFSNLNNVMTPLYTTKKSGQGLGLTICKEIIERHNGKLAITNVSGGGKVSISLPLVDECEN